MHAVAEQSVLWRNKTAKPAAIVKCLECKETVNTHKHYKIFIEQMETFRMFK